MRLDAESLKRLEGVHPDLVSVVNRAARFTTLDFKVTEGVRSIERQRKLVDEGASRTMKSRHLTGHAVDVAAMIDGVVHWDWPLYARLADVFKEQAAILDVRIEWGGDWRSFKDGPHFQLPRAAYP